MSVQVALPGPYRETLPAGVRAALDCALGCVDCRRRAKVCANRSLRLMNFGFDCAAQADRQGAVLTARLGRSLFELVRRLSHWNAEHFALAELHCRGIVELTKPAGEPMMGVAIEQAFGLAEEWVARLEKHSRLPDGPTPCRVDAET